MASQIDIVNYAGVKLGAEAVLTSIEESNKLARTARAVWAIALDATLAAHPWNFAIARAALPPIVDAPAFGYVRQFQRPADLVRLVEVNGVHVWSLEPGANPPYQYEGDRILCDLGLTLYIRYVRRIEDTVQFSAGFVEAMACKLAQEMALPITESATTRDMMGADFRAAIGEAKGTDGRENPPEMPLEDDWILAREAC